MRDAIVQQPPQLGAGEGLVYLSDLRHSLLVEAEAIWHLRVAVLCHLLLAFYVRTLSSIFLTQGQSVSIMQSFPIFFFQLL